MSDDFQILCTNVTIFSMLQCPFCEVDLPQKFKISKESIGFNQVVTLLCEECQNSSLLDIDLKMKVFRAPFKCDKCGDVFIDNECFAQHRGKCPTVRFDLLFSCVVCKAGFETRSEYEKHSASHNRKCHCSLQ